MLLLPLTKAAGTLEIFPQGLKTGEPQEQELTVNWYEGSYWGDKNVLQLDYGDGCTTQ